MPAAVLNAFAEQLPRISAEESLLAAERTAVGSGSLKRGAGRQIVGAWHRQAGQPRLVIRPLGREMYDAQMAMAGIRVKREKRADG